MKPIKEIIAGLDCLVASFISNHKCKIYGLDMKEAMLQKSRENVLKAELGNIHFIKGHAENIPMPSASVDLVISIRKVSYTSKCSIR